MIENLPGYISIVFILTTFLTIGFFFFAIRQTNLFQTTSRKNPYRRNFILVFLTMFSGN